MKKIIGLFVMFGMVLFATSLYAADGDKVTITGSGGGGNLEFLPSPSTSMATITTAIAYNVTAWSDKNIGEDAGMQYLVSSAANGVYQRKLGEAAAAVGTAGTIDSGTWLQKK